MKEIMKEIAESTVSDKDVMDWLRDYAVPRIRMMRAMAELKQLADPVIKQDQIPGFVMSTEDYGHFRAIQGSVMKTESMAFGFEPETATNTLKKGIFGHLFGFMPVKVLKDIPETKCVAVTPEF